MLALFRHHQAIFLFFFRFTRQFPSCQHMCRHQYGVQRRLHIMNHGVSKVFLELLQTMLHPKHLHLAEDTIEHYQECNPQGKQKIPDRSRHMTIRVLHNSLHTKRTIFFQRNKQRSIITILPGSVSNLCNRTIRRTEKLTNTTT